MDVEVEIREAVERIYAKYGPDLGAFFRDVEAQVKVEREKPSDTDPKDARIAALEAKLKVRSGPLPAYCNRPIRWNARGSSAAYDSGYEAGYRNWEFRNPYVRSDCSRAFTEGYQRGQEDARAAIERAVGGVR